jgi:hypothetical protein
MDVVQSASSDGLSIARESASAAAGLDAAVATLHARLAGIELSDPSGVPTVPTGVPTGLPTGLPTAMVPPAPRPGRHASA